MKLKTDLAKNFFLSNMNVAQQIRKYGCSKQFQGAKENARKIRNFSPANFVKYP